MKIEPGTGRTYGIATLLLSLFLGGAAHLRAEEGMWIPMLLERYQIERLEEAGLKLSADEIYSINRDCLKDAIVIFGGGCTGEIISREGLLLTNHHCGEDEVRSHSSVENDYLSNGFWAMSREEEMPNEDLTVTFLRYMEDVTEEVNENLIPGMDPLERTRQMELNKGKLIREATNGTYLDAIVKPLYHGNAHYLFVYETYLDVRLVGAPPVSIGNFGGDRDNWMWPRHTGDFSLFRVYAGEDNEPAEYSPSNIPYRPRRHLEIAAGGVDEEDFTMILGYPGSTDEYLHSEAVRNMLEISLPLKIRLRTIRLEIMDRYMKESDNVRIQYASKYRRVSNSWKKWEGVIHGLNHSHVVERKIREEQEFDAWLDSDGLRQLKYGGVLGDLSSLHSEARQFLVANDMMDEAIMPVELFRQGVTLVSMMRQGQDVEVLRDQIERFYKDYHMPLDRDIFAAMLEASQKTLPESLHPPFFTRVKSKYKWEWQEFAADIYKKSILATREDALKLAEVYAADAGSAIRQLMKDPIIASLGQFTELYMTEVNPGWDRLEHELEKQYKIYMEALLEKSANSMLYPDANSTLRLTFGKVEGYQPMDGIRYLHRTTLSGVMEKAKEGTGDYDVPEKLARLYREKDFGRYGVNGTMPVCFVASNHTSGGNSGSPVLDGNGRLIGLNFDRNWEGTMSDIEYDPGICRNIAVDIRYVLFIIDKFAGAGYLVDEMDIIW